MTLYMYLKFRLQSPFSTPQLGSVLFGQTDKKNFSFAKGTKRKTKKGTNHFCIQICNCMNFRENM